MAAAATAAVDLAAWPDGLAVLVDRVAAFIDQEGCSDAQFDALATALFAFQYAHNEPLRRFCQRRGALPRRVQGWRDVPPVPISAFKDATLSCVDPARCERVFTTSGTTREDVRGRHHHPTIAVWDRSMLRHFDARLLRGAAGLPMLRLFPDEAALPNSSLARYLSLAARERGGDGGGCFVGADGIDVDGVVAALAAVQACGRPAALLGASYSIVHLLDALRASGRRFALPAGSLVLDTGGYKNRSREMAPADFYAALEQTFGVARERCVNMYGMTELSSQFYDNGNAVLPSVKHPPHWVRSRVLDPLTGQDMPHGEPGLLMHCDLANVNSTLAVLTEDVGIASGDGFVLLGRAEGAAAKGCSLALEEFLEAARR